MSTRHTLGWMGYLVTILLLPCTALAQSGGTMEIIAPSDSGPKTRYGLERLQAALKKAGYATEITTDRPKKPTADSILLDVGPAGNPSTATRPAVPEAYTLSREPGAPLTVGAADDAGLMYACLDLARRVQDTGKLPAGMDVHEQPTMRLRGTCILLMKLGLYDYPITPEEFPFFYDKALWAEYLDFLADNRFNYIAFWNGHPFDYFVKLDRYPEAQNGMPAGVLERNHDMLMWLGQEARRRNIWLMFQFYQIHTSTYFAKAHNLPPHGNSAPTPLLADYTGYAIERFVSKFPSVGLYVCPGEMLELKHQADWINNVIFAAVNRTGKNPPIMIRAWGIDLPNMKKVAGHYSPLYTERKFNVEHIAGTEVDPANRDWSALTGNHVVNIHCLGNLEPFRWSPPSYIQKCITSSIRDGGASGLHLYPRKAWRWPYGCDRTDERELQWHRDRLWFEAWARYAWNPQRPADQERVYWLEQLARHFGSAEAAAHLLSAHELQADILPGVQRLFWLGDDNHTVVASGMNVEQIQRSAGVPFLPVPGMVRMPDYLKSLVEGRKLEGTNPVDFFAAKSADAEQALKEAKLGAALATRNREEAGRLVSDLEAVLLLTRFYHEKTQAAAAHYAFAHGQDPAANIDRCLRHLEESLNQYRKLTKLTRTTYESISDVPMWYPIQGLKTCPYHWSDVLPHFEEELAIAKHNAGVLEKHPEVRSTKAEALKAEFFKTRLSSE